MLMADYFETCNMLMDKRSKYSKVDQNIGFNLSLKTFSISGVTSAMQLFTPGLNNIWSGLAASLGCYLQNRDLWLNITFK